MFGSCIGGSAIATIGQNGVILTNDAITQRLIAVAEKINQKLDDLDMKCDRVSVKITEWSTCVELDVFNESDSMTLKFDIAAGYNSAYRVSDYREEITIGS